MSKVLESVYGAPDKPLKIGEVEIPCYVLNDGTRVVTQRGFQKVLGMSEGGGKRGERKIPQFLDHKSIKELVSNELRASAKNVIQFKIPNGTSAVGYNAVILQEVVRTLSKAYLKGQLIPSHLHIGKICELLDDGFSKVGIVALIDEATGYQAVRERDSLQTFLNKFLQEERAKWVKTFPDEFFEMIFKMKNWTWYYAGKQKPSVMGHYINDFVYSRIAPKVLDELRTVNPKLPKGQRKYKHTQFISTDYGHPKLKEHLSAVIALGKASGYNWNQFKRLVERALPKFGDTLEIPYQAEDEVN